MQVEVSADTDQLPDRLAQLVVPVVVVVEDAGRSWKRRGGAFTTQSLPTPHKPPTLCAHLGA